MRVNLIVTALLITSALYSQPADPGLKFEVVSVKPATMQPGVGLGIFTYPGGRVRANGCPLDYLLQEAFRLQSFQLSGGPRWVRDDRFDLEAKPPASSKSSQSNPNNPKLPPNEEQRQMLQAALVERFQLKYHWENKEGPIYSLVKTGKQLKLQDAKDKEDYPWVGSFAGGAMNGDGIAAINATMPLLADRLSRAMGRLVVDRTGIEGAFDFKIANPGGSELDIPSMIMAAIQELGLKLEAGRGPVPTLVIDSAEKPSAN